MKVGFRAPQEWMSTKITYNTKDSPVVTDLSTSLALASLTRGERTGSRVFWQVWSYVIDVGVFCSISKGGLERNHGMGIPPNDWRHKQSL